MSRSSTLFHVLLAAFVALLGSLLFATPARAQVVDVNLRTTVFHEPSSKKSQMTVVTPAATLAVMPWEWLTVSGHYEADVVSGASEPIKAGPLSSPDIISQASVKDVRHVFGGSFTLKRKDTHLTAGYTYGAENDYKSNGIAVSAGTDFLKKNTQIELSYARGFDEVCNVAYPVTRDPTLRQRLDSSKGCFTSDATKQSQDIDIDTFQAAWTQSWTPLFTTQVVGSFQLQHGFLGNPYRGVVIGATGQIAQEHHPDNRARSAIAVRGKYYIKGAKTTIGLGVRGYRDTWDILSQTVQLDAERYMLPWLRLLVRGRYYNQGGALFWSDDYTGGEPQMGPRGQYWTGDRELSPLKSYMLGGRVLGEWRGRPGDRIFGMLLTASAGANLDVVKTNLEEFTLAGQAPDDTWAFILGLGVSGGF
ncbi:MAG: DUF3570 domain-containing protein [Myxococcales bacterium]|nr:DUF3570 domain-containing protein [Myxococcales bacterium]MCB9580615.1 DUF3570 domain-containing protein [Polyangiaceae bacterium]